MEAAPIDKTSNYLAYIIAFTVISWNNAIQVVRVITRRLGFSDIPGDVLAPVEVGDNTTANGQSVFIIHGIMIGYAGNTAMHIGPTQVFRAHLFACRCFYQRRSGQEDCAIPAHDHRLIAHGGHICSSRSAGTHDSGNLWNALA